MGAVHSAKHGELSAILVGVLLGSAAVVSCGAEEPLPKPRADAPPVALPNSLVYERREFFEGLEEWILIHKSPSEYYCVRADGRREDCISVREEDEAAHHRKWGVMTKALGTKVVAADETTTFEVYVTYYVEVPEKMEGPAKEKFFAEVRAGGERLTKQIVDGGGEVLVPPNTTMPELSMRGSAWLIKQLAWSPQIVLITERLPPNGSVGRNADIGPARSVACAE